MRVNLVGQHCRVQGPSHAKLASHTLTRQADMDSSALWVSESHLNGYVCMQFTAWGFSW